MHISKVWIYYYKCIVNFKWLDYSCVSFLDLLNMYSGARPFSCSIAVRMEPCVPVFLYHPIRFLVGNEPAVLSFMYAFVHVYTNKGDRLLKTIPMYFCLPKECPAIETCLYLPVLVSWTLQWFPVLMHNLSRSPRSTWPFSTNHWLYFSWLFSLF